MANQIVAYQDERHGLGAWVAEQVAAHMFRYGMWVDDSGVPVRNDDGSPATGGRTPPDPTAAHLAASYGVSLSTSRNMGGASVMDAPRKQDDQLDFAYKTWTSPRASAEAIFGAVIGQQAQVGVLPLYDNDRSFNKDTLGALMDFPQNNVLREYVAESNYVLAAPTDLIHEIEQSGYTNSFSETGNTSAFAWNREKQMRYMRKVTKVYASADAMQHCAAAIEGLRAKGVDVQLIPDGVDTYREGLRLASEMLDPDRRIETKFSGSKHSRVSRTTAANHSKPVVAVLLSHDKAINHDGYDYNSDYVVLDAEMAGADRIRTSFIAMKRGIPAIPGAGTDHTSFEMKALRKHFQPPSSRPRQGVDHRALYPIAGDNKWPDVAAAEIPAYVRFIYKFDTVGDKVRDFAKVLQILNEERFSYTTTTLDNRSGHPMVVAIDVPADRWKDVRPVIRAITAQKNARRLADFPALQPMIPEAIRPATITDGKTRLMITAIGLIIVALAGFVLLNGNV